MEYGIMTNKQIIADIFPSLSKWYQEFFSQLPSEKGPYCTNG